MGMKLKRNNQQPRPFESTAIDADQGLINQVTTAMRRRLLADEVIRCASCFHWQPEASAQIGVYITPDRIYIAYVLCPKCAQLVKVSEQARRRVAAYVSGVN